MKKKKQEVNLQLFPFLMSGIIRLSLVVFYLVHVGEMRGYRPLRLAISATLALDSPAIKSLALQRCNLLIFT